MSVESSGVETPFFESVVSRMNGFLYRCRADSEFTMLKLTSGFERCCAFPADDVLGNTRRSFASLIHPDDAAAVDEAVVVGLQQKRNWNINYRLLHAAGPYVWVHEDGGGVWDETGAVVYLEGAVFDMHHLYASLEAQFARLQAAPKTSDAA
jgi:PAS domain-containing protein